MKNRNQNRQLSVGPQTVILRALRLLIVPVIALFVFQSGAVASFAQMPDDPSTVDLEQFRAELIQTVQRLNASAEKMKSNPLFRNRLNKSGKQSVPNTAFQSQMEKLNYQELEQIYRAFNMNFPNWRESAGAMERIAERVDKYSGVDTSSAITPDDCNIVFVSQPSWTDWSITKSSELGAQAVYEGIPEPINLIALTAWTPIAIGAAYAEFENVLFDRCSGDQSNAELTNLVNTTKSQIVERVDTNADYVIDRLTTVGNNLKTEIVNNDNANKTMIVNNDNTNKTTIVDAINSAQTSINQNTTSSQTAITTAITSAKTEIVNNDNSNRTTIINNDNSNATALTTNINNTRNAIITNDNSNATNIINNSNANTTNIINNSNANTTTLNTAINNAKTEIINNAAANKNELSKLLLRTQIEADLATESNGVKVAWYMTPTAKGGHLDYVQQIVTETLANITAAGGSIGNAQSFLDRANADKAAGNFKSAYDNYRKAYKAAAN